MEEGNYAYYELYSISGSDITADEFMNEIQLRYYNEEGIVRIEDKYYDIPMYYEAGFDGYGAGYESVAVETADVSFSSNVDNENFYTHFGKRCTNLVKALEELGIVNDTWHLYTYEEYDMLSSEQKNNR